MPKYSGNDHYIDPDSGVLRNRLGITDQSLLEAAEADFVAERSRELSQTPLAGRFDLAQLQAIHRHLFGDVYEWAGELRDVDISKGAARFAHHATSRTPQRRSSRSLRQRIIWPSLALPISATAPRISSAN